MSSEVIDNKVVQMDFNNKTFEKNTADTIKSLGNLKKALDLGTAGKGFSDIETQSGRVNFTGLNKAVQEISSRFTTLGIIGVTALQNITNSVINLARTIVSELLSNAAIKTGFDEYEEKINAVQVILSNTKSKGTTLDQVNDALAELNTYADQTIYNFTEMTKNIGTFTAAGVELDTSVGAIKGIANLAAVSGSSATQASTAMYQLSQAISSGRVALMDWNSVENAGMGGEIFKNALMDKAEAMGVFVDRTQSFRDSISGGDSWLSSDILLSVLNDFAEDADMQKAATQVKTFTQLMDTLKEAKQSGWAVTWEQLIGDFSQAPVLFTAINDAIGGFIGRQADARNAFVGTFVELGGRDAIINTVSNSFKALSNVMTIVSKNFREVFPKGSPKAFVNILKVVEGVSKAFKDFTEQEETIKVLNGIFSAFFHTLGLVKYVGYGVIAIFKGIGSAIAYLTPYAAEVVDYIGILATKFATFVKENENVQRAIQFGNAIFTDFVGTLISLRDNIVDVITNLASMAGAFILNFDAEQAALYLAEALEFLNSILGSTEDLLISVSDGIASFINSTREKISDLGFGKTNKDLEKTSSILDKIAEGFDWLVQKAKALGATLIDGLGSIHFDPTLIAALFAGGVGGGSFVMFKKIGEAIKGLSETADGAIKNNPINAFSDAISQLGDTIEAFQLKIKAEALKSIAIAIAILAGSLVVLSFVDKEKLANGLSALLFLMVGLIAVNKKAEMVSSLNPLRNASFTIIKLAAAMLIISAAVKVMGSMDNDQLVAGLAGTAVMLVMIRGFLVTVSKLEGGFTSGVISLTAVALAIVIMSKAVVTLGTIPFNQMVQGLNGLAGLLLSLIILTKVIKEDELKNLAKMGPSFIAIGLAMVALAGAVKIIGTMSPESAITGVVAIGTLMAMLAVSLSVMTKESGSILGAAAGVLIVAIALTELVAVVALFAALGGENLTTGLFAIGGSLLIIAAAMTAMEGSLAGAGAILVVSMAMGALLPVMAALSLIPLEKVGVALLALGGALGIFVAAGYLLSPVVAVIAVFAISVAALSASIILAGVGLGALAIGFGKLAAVLTLSGTAIVAGIGVIVNGVVELAPKVGAAMGAAMISFANAIVNGVPAVTQAFIMTVISIMDILIQYVPEMSAKAIQLFSVIGKAVHDVTPEVVKFIVGLITDIIMGIVSMADQLVFAGIELIVALIDGLAIGLRAHQNEILHAIMNLLEAIIELVLTTVQTLLRLIPGVGDKMADALEDVKTEMRKGALNPEDYEDMGADAAEGLATGALSKSGEVESAFGVTGGLGASGFLGTSDQYEDAGAASVESLETGASGQGSRLTTLMTKFGLDGMTDFSTAFDGYNLGSDSIIQTASGMNNEGDIIANSGMGAALEGVGGYTSQIGLYSDAGGLSVDMLAQGMEENANTAEEAGKTVASKADEGLDTGDPFTIGESKVEDLGDGIISKGQFAYSKGGETAKKVLEGYGSADFYTPGVTSMEDIINATNDKKSDVESAASGVAKAGSTAMTSEEISTSFYNSGVNLTAGFVNGINSKLAEAQAAANTLGTISYQALRTGIQERSPSHLTYASGEYFVYGFANAIVDNVKLAVKAASGLGSGAVGAVSNAITNIADALSMSSDFTIRPVLDLSDVEAGMQYLNNLFNATKLGVGVDANGNVIGEVPDKYGNTYNITINAGSADAKDIAREIEKIIVRN